MPSRPTPSRKPTAAKKPAVGAAKSTARKPAARPVAARTTAPSPLLSDAAKKLRAVHPGEQATVLTFPYEARGLGTAYGAKWEPEVKAHVIFGEVPPVLQYFVAQPLSWDRWIEDEINGFVKPVPTEAKFQPRPHQEKAAQAIEYAAKSGLRGFVEADGTGIGKGLAASTLIPTPKGFITMEELKVGDDVLSNSGEPTRVLAKYLSQAKKFYRVTFSDGTTVDADEDHRWLTSSTVERARKSNQTETRYRLSTSAEASLRKYLLSAQEAMLPVSFRYCFEAGLFENEGFTRLILAHLKPVGKLGKQSLYHPQEALERLDRFLVQSNKWQTNADRASIKNTRELFDTQQYLPTSSKNSRNNHSVVTSHPIGGQTQSLPIDPYVLGAWLGDGGAHHGTITSMDQDIIARIANHYPIRSVRLDSRTIAKTYRFEGLNSELHKLYEQPIESKLIKTIPDRYLSADIQQRLGLLKGLLDTDGSIGSQDGQGVTFAQKDPTLFFQVYSLICSLGWKATWRSKEITKAFGQTREFGTYYELTFYPSEQVFYLPRKANLLASRLESFASNPRRSQRYITEVVEIEKSEDYYCISVDAPNHLYLCTRAYIPTHNTLSSLLGAERVAKVRGFSPTKQAKLLIICPKSVIPHWRNTIRMAGVKNLRIAVINYDQALKLLAPAEKTGNVKTTRAKNNRTAGFGRPNVMWDLVIADEAHRLKNGDAQRSKAFDRIARYSEITVKAPFVIWASATIGQTPLELGYLAPLMGQLTGKASVATKEWGQYLFEQGYQVEKKKSGWAWIKPKAGATGSALARVLELQAQDVERLAGILFHPKAPSLRRAAKDIAGWPEIQRIPVPVELAGEEMELYRQAWVQFRKDMRLHARGKNPKAGVVVQLRFRQKAGLLLAPYTLDLVEDLLENGYQVAVSCEFMESIDVMRPKLEHAGYRTAEYSGRNEADRERERLRFQMGEADVIFFTVTEGISLHAGEQLPGGHRATDRPRATVVNDLRYSALATFQIEGRAHRDGQQANIYYVYPEKTVVQKILNVLLMRMRNVTKLSGDDAATTAKIDELLNPAE